MTAEQAQAQAHQGNTSPDMRKNRGWILTLWDENHIIKDDCIYTVVGEEVCPDTGKTHWHQFIYFKNPRHFNGIKKLTSDKSHIEPMYGLISQAVEYCKKDGKIVYETGTQPNDNGRKNIKKIVEDSKSLTEIMEKDPETYCQYRNGLKDLMTTKNRKNRFIKAPIVTWIYGSTGRGKTERAFKSGATPVEYNNGYFSDWGDAKIICIEELRGEIPYKALLKILDRYHNYYEVNIKNGQKLVDLDEIWITSPVRPEKLYTNQVNKEDSIDQLLRRITTFINVDREDIEYKTIVEEE